MLRDSKASLFFLSSARPETQGFVICSAKSKRKSHHLPSKKAYNLTKSSKDKLKHAKTIQNLYTLDRFTSLAYENTSKRPPSCAFSSSQGCSGMASTFSINWSMAA